MDAMMSSVLSEANSSLMSSQFWAPLKPDHSQQKQDPLYRKVSDRPQSIQTLLTEHTETRSHQAMLGAPDLQHSLTHFSGHRSQITREQERPHSSPSVQALDMTFPSIIVTQNGCLDGEQAQILSLGHADFSNVIKSTKRLHPQEDTYPSNPQDDTFLDVDSPLARLSFSRPVSPARHGDIQTVATQETASESRHTPDDDRLLENNVRTDGFTAERLIHLDTFPREYFSLDDDTGFMLNTNHQIRDDHDNINGTIQSLHRQTWLNTPMAVKREVTMHEINGVTDSVDSCDDMFNESSMKYDDSDYSDASLGHYSARFTSAASHITTDPHNVMDHTQSVYTHSLSSAVPTPTWPSSSSPVQQATDDVARATPTDLDDSQDTSSSTKAGKHKEKAGVKARGAQNLPPCRICGNNASGLHFGVNTCEACNEFFRRRLKRGATYYCSKNRDCQVYGKKRNACSYCRYQRCLEMGMSRDAIKTGRYSHKTRTEYAMEVEKFKIKEVNRVQMEKHLVLVGDLVKYHDKYVKVTTRVPDEELVISQKKYLQLYQTQAEHERRHPPLKTTAPNKQLLDDWTQVKEDLSLTMHDAEMTEHWLRNYINFAKNVPGFKELALSDQASLVRGSWFEFWFLGAFRGYNNQLQVVAYPNGRCFHRDEIQKVFGEEYTDFSFYLAERMRSLQVSPEVMVLIKTVCLTFPDRTPLENKLAVDDMHWSLVSCLLHTLEKDKSADQAITFPLVVSKLVELRTLTDIAMRAHKSALFQDVLKESPLLCEMVDTKTRYVASVPDQNTDNI